MRQLADSSEPFDPSQTDFNGGMQGSDFQTEGSNGLSNYEGGGDMSDMSDPQEGFGEGFGDQPGQDGGALGASQRADSANNDSSQGGGAGGGPSRVDQYQKPNANGLSPGKVLELRGRPGESGTSTTDNDPRVPLVSSNDGSIGATVGSARSVIVDALSVRGEQNFVPWEKRQVVKDYFTGSGK
jgi:hypothetical protein